MDNTQYQQYIKKYQYKTPYLKNCLYAFVFGGFMGAIGEFIIEAYKHLFNFTEKEATAPMLVTIIFVASILTGIGILDKVGQIAGAGLFIPITGFANSMTSAALEHKSEGIVLGIAANMFILSGSVLTLGVVSAAFFGTIRFLFFGG